jgi:hypothetical protein
MDSPATALPANEPRMEVLVGGACELHLDDGRVLRGDLQPAPTDATHCSCSGRRPAQACRVPGALLLRLAVPARPAAHAARRFTLALPALQTLTAPAAARTAAHGGLWLDVQLPDGRCEAWLLPPRSLPLLRWLGQAGPPAAGAAQRGRAVGRAGPPARRAAPSTWARRWSKPAWSPRRR